MVSYQHLTCELDTADEDMLFNRASLGVYELGSIFKVFTVAMAMNKAAFARPTNTMLPALCSLAAGKSATGRI